MGFFQDVRTHVHPFLISLFICTASVSFGYDSGYFGGIQTMQPFLSVYGHFDTKSMEYAVSSSTLSLITSIINVGEFVGATSAFWIGNKLGYKHGLYVSSTAVVVGAIFQVAGTVEATLIIGRLFTGYGVGLLSCFVPLLVADCAPAVLRGASVAAYQLGIASGLVLGTAVTYKTQPRHDTGAYRIPMAIIILWPVILVPGLLTFVPESPRWLLGHNRYDAAARALRKLNGKTASADALEAELAIMRTSIETERELYASAGWRQIFTWGPEGRKAYLGFALQALQQGSGINFITSYGIYFFTQTGIKNSYLAIMGVYFMCFPGIFLASFISERFGRRPTLIVSGILCAATSIVMGGMGLIAEKNESENGAIAAMVFLFLVFFNMGWGPLVWVVCSEISVGRNRGKLMSFSTGSNWFFNWVVSFSFPYLYGADQANLGPKIGFIYGALMILSCFWVYYILPETAGRTLEEIDEMFEAHVPARKFSSYICENVLGTGQNETKSEEETTIHEEKP
ncbi:hypothetical protein V502_03052 [Pseudogymnoascus sp. VKM F-4520 (FW-2644)]|nr:hypothetical protein V502_03052 [Pseudogymnoascus sp. VKM F-4520 (FW-2644)]